MEIHLVVVRPFSGLDRGDTVTDPTQVAEILASEQSRSVVRVYVAATKES